MQFTMADTIAAKCFAHPDRTAVEVLDGSAPVSYGEIWRRTEALTQAIENTPAGKHGPMLGMLLPNGIDAALCYLACQRSAITGVAINGRLSEREMLDIIKDSDCRSLISAGALLPRAQAVCQSAGIELIDAACIATPEQVPHPVLGDEQAGERACVVAYSSGTTGTPKGAIYSNDYFTMNNFRWGWEFGLSYQHVILISGPMFHLSYAGFALAGLMIGARVRIMPEFSAQLAFEELDSQASFAFLVPSMLTMLREQWQERGQGMQAAKHIISAGAPLPVELAAEAMDMFPNACIAEMYGSTETGFISYEVKDAETLLPHSVGWPAIGADVCIFAEDGGICGVGQAGEVGVRSGVAFPGYLGNPQATEAAWHSGYLMSGDIGIWQADGRLCIVDRKKDVIITGGENVYTAEVERVLLEHPDVAEAAVIGMPDKLWGERVSAALVVHDGRHIEASELEQFCRDSLADYKVPRQYAFLNEIPRNAMGKVQKFKLGELL